jgi:hypothetical protein
MQSSKRGRVGSFDQPMQFDSRSFELGGNAAPIDDVLGHRHLAPSAPTCSHHHAR